MAWPPKGQARSGRPVPKSAFRPPGGAAAGLHHSLRRLIGGVGEGDLTPEQVRAAFLAAWNRFSTNAV